MYCNLGDMVSSYGTSSLGALFTSYPYFQNDNFALYIPPQVSNDTAFYITDTLGWQLVQMPFVADSAYTYVTIGNFLPDMFTTYVPVLTGAYPRSYLLFDDISLEIDSTSGTEEHHQNAISVYPNPFDEMFTIISGDQEECEVFVYDVSSRLVLRKKFYHEITFSSSLFSSGIYFYEIRSSGKTPVAGKLIKR
jgi:hypothetical protein